MAVSAAQANEKSVLSAVAHFTATTNPMVNGIGALKAGKQQQQQHVFSSLEKKDYVLDSSPVKYPDSLTAGSSSDDLVRTLSLDQLSTRAVSKSSVTSLGVTHSVVSSDADSEDSGKVLLPELTKGGDHDWSDDDFEHTQSELHITRAVDESAMNVTILNVVRQRSLMYGPDDGDDDSSSDTSGAGSEGSDIDVIMELSGASSTCVTVTGDESIKHEDSTAAEESSTETEDALLTDTKQTEDSEVLQKELTSSVDVSTKNPSESANRFEPFSIVGTHMAEQKSEKEQQITSTLMDGTIINILTPLSMLAEEVVSKIERNLSDDDDQQKLTLISEPTAVVPIIQDKDSAISIAKQLTEANQPIQCITSATESTIVELPSELTGTSNSASNEYAEVSETVARAVQIEQLDQKPQELNESNSHQISNLLAQTTEEPKEQVQEENEKTKMNEKVKIVTKKKSRQEEEEEKGREEEEYDEEEETAEETDTEGNLAGDEASETSTNVSTRDLSWVQEDKGLSHKDASSHPEPNRRPASAPIKMRGEKINHILSATSMISFPRHIAAHVAIDLGDVELQERAEGSTSKLIEDDEEDNTPLLSMKLPALKPSATRSSGHPLHTVHREHPVMDKGKELLLLQQKIMATERELSQLKDQLRWERLQWNTANTDLQLTIQQLREKLDSVQKSKNDQLQSLEKRLRIVEGRMTDVQVAPVSNPLVRGALRKSVRVSTQQADKLRRFFGDNPPLLEQFLGDLGYKEYVPRFVNEKIGIVELPHLSEWDLINLGIPLGPRLRILHESQTLSLL